MTILANMSDEGFDDEILQMILDEVEHIDKMKKVYIVAEWPHWFVTL